MNRTTTLTLAALVFAACSDAGLTGPDGGDADLVLSAQPSPDAASTLRVMTRNMYVGTDVDAVIEAESPDQIPFLVADAWDLLLATDYPGRAQAMAEEIARERPHLVGLQEVSLVRTQFPADFQVNAEDVVFDFIPTLLEALAAVGEEYRVVAQIQNIDVELPRLNPGFSLTDVRLTDFDAILARADVRVSNVSEQNFAAVVPVPGTPIVLRRGWVAVDATVRGQTFRFVNTHLEPVEIADGFIQGLQAQELIGILAAETRPLVLVGDLNTEAITGDTYNLLLAAGYTDAWSLRAGPPADGFTCCHDTDLLNETSGLFKRIDHVMLRNVEALYPPSGAASVQAQVVGGDPKHKTVSGLWPSDHGGVSVRLQFPDPASGP